MGISGWFLVVGEGISWKLVRFMIIIHIYITCFHNFAYVLNLSILSLQVSGARIKISDRGDFMSGTTDRYNNHSFINQLPKHWGNFSQNNSFSVWQESDNHGITESNPSSWVDDNAEGCIRRWEGDGLVFYGYQNHSCWRVFWWYRLQLPHIVWLEIYPH